MKTQQEDKWWSTSQPQKKSTLPAPWPQTSGLHECGQIEFCRLSPLVCGTLLGSPGKPIHGDTGIWTYVSWLWSTFPPILLLGLESGGLHQWSSSPISPITSNQCGLRQAGILSCSVEMVEGQFKARGKKTPLEMRLFKIGWGEF